MDRRRWCTKKDVQEDLARATGQRRLPDVDEGYFVYGERPPPPRICADEADCEVELQLAGTAASGGAGGPGGGQLPPPDLCGITKMLRMVQNYGDGDRREDSATVTQTNDVIVISKPNQSSSKRELTIPPSTNDDNSILASTLNPDVKEFIPRPTALSYSSPSNDSAGARNAEIDSEKSNRSLPPGHPANDVEEGKGDVASSVDRYEIERGELAAMLKSRIYSAQATQGDSPEFRRQKYAAIANLLKLHSTPLASLASPAPPAPPAPVTLRTPDYFANRRADPAEVEETAERTDPTLGREPAGGPGERAADVDLSEVRASIRKVNDWMDSKPGAPPSPAPSPAPHLGPVAYKRKQRPGPASPAPPASPGDAGGAVKLAKPAAYVPSAHAQELSRRYEQRAQRGGGGGGSGGAGEGGAPRDVWQRLHEELRRRDEDILRMRRALPE